MSSLEPRYQALHDRNYKHGESGQPLHRVWAGIRRRCNNSNVAQYKDYGGRGIYVDPQWDDYVPFRDWAVAHGYAEGLQLDRIDNDGPYSPENCRFVTRVQNARNRRGNVVLAALGESKCLSEWAEDPRCVVGFYTFRERVRRLGWPVDRALTTPSRNSRNGRSS